MGRVGSDDRGVSAAFPVTLKYVISKYTHRYAYRMWWTFTCVQTLGLNTSSTGMCGLGPCSRDLKQSMSVCPVIVLCKRRDVYDILLGHLECCRIRYISIVHSMRIILRIIIIIYVGTYFFPPYGLFFVQINAILLWTLTFF